MAQKHKVEQVKTNAAGVIERGARMKHEERTLIKDATLAELPNMLSRLPKAQSVKVYDEKGKHLDRYQGIKNMQTKEVCQIFNDTYWLTNHADVAEAATDAMVELGLKGKCTVECSPQGERMTMYVLFDKHLIPDNTHFDFDPKDSKATGIQYGICIQNSFDASYPIRVSSYGQRLVCSNGMVATAAFTKVSCMHTIDRRTGKAPNINAEMTGMIRDAINGEKKFQAIVEAAMKDSYGWEQTQAIIARLMDKELAFKHLQEIFAKVGVTIIKIKDEKTKKWRVDIIKEKNYNPSRWALYNAFTDTATNGETIGYAMREHLNKLSERILTNDRKLTEVMVTR